MSKVFTIGMNEGEPEKVLIWKGVRELFCDSLILIFQMKIMKAQFANCNLSFSCAIDLGIAMLWPRNEENSALLRCEISKVLVPRWQASTLHRIIQAALTASFITFVCFTGAFAYSVIQLMSVLQVISRQRPEPALAPSPCQAGAFPAAQPAASGAVAMREGWWPPSESWDPAAVCPQRRGPHSRRAECWASQSPGGGFLWGKIAVMWLAVPQINGCDSLHCFRQKMATCCCSEIMLSAKHTAPLDPFMPWKGGRNPG